MRDAAVLVLGGNPSESFVLGIGRSPAAVLEVVSRFPNGRARQIPLSGFRFQPAEGVDAGLAPLTEAEEKTLFEHFDRYVPSKDELDGRRLIVVDYCENGYSLIGASLFLQKYLRQRGREETELEVVALTDRLIRDRIIANMRYARLSTKVLSFDAKDPFATNLIRAEYDTRAREGAYYLGSPGIAKQSKANATFSEAVARKMAADKTFTAPDWDWESANAALEKGFASRDLAVVRTWEDSIGPKESGKERAERRRLEKWKKSCRDGWRRIVNR